MRIYLERKYKIIQHGIYDEVEELNCLVTLQELVNLVEKSCENMDEVESLRTDDLIRLAQSIAHGQYSTYSTDAEDVKFNISDYGRCYAL